MIDFKRLRTVKQVASEEGSPFTEGSLRWLIFNAESNGFEAALVHVGRRVLIDIDSFNRWLERDNGEN